MFSAVRGCAATCSFRRAAGSTSPTLLRSVVSMKATEERETSVNEPLASATGPPELEVVKIEEAGNEAWSGVVQAESEGSRLPEWLYAYLSFLRKVSMYTIFAGVGRASHGEGLSFAGVLGTALPFLLGWYVAASLLGGYGSEARSGKVAPAALTSLKCWLLGDPLGLALHGLAVGHVPPRTFVVVASAFTLVAMTGWRSCYAAMTPSSTGAGISAKRRGNPFEFLSFLNSIVRRW